jgi:protein scribble
MIPPHFLQNGGGSESSSDSGGGDATKIVSLTIKKPPEKKLLNGIELPAAPTGLGRVTETITKSTFTETVVTRITDNHLAEPVIVEVSPNIKILTLFSLPLS